MYPLYRIARFASRPYPQRLRHNMLPRQPLRTAAVGASFFRLDQLPVLPHNVRPQHLPTLQITKRFLHKSIMFFLYLLAVRHRKRPLCDYLRILIKNLIPINRDSASLLFIFYFLLCFKIPIRHCSYLFTFQHPTNFLSILQNQLSSMSFRSLRFPTLLCLGFYYRLDLKSSEHCHLP